MNTDELYRIAEVLSDAEDPILVCPICYGEIVDEYQKWNTPRDGLFHYVWECEEGHDFTEPLAID